MMERAYCQLCRREIPYESGHVCKDCKALNPIRASIYDEPPPRPVMATDDPSPTKALMVFAFSVGLCAGCVLGAWRAACVQRAWDEDSLAWEKARAAAYDSGYEAGRRLAGVEAAIMEVNQ